MTAVLLSGLLAFCSAVYRLYFSKSVSLLSWKHFLGIFCLWAQIRTPPGSGRVKKSKAPPSRQDFRRAAGRHSWESVAWIFDAAVALERGALS